MQTRLIRVVPDAEGWGEWTARKIKENPAKSIAAVLVSPVIVVPAIPTLLGLTAVAAAGVGIDLWYDHDEVERMELRNALALRDPDGRIPVVNKVYAYHPDSSRENLVLSASTFHSALVSEQIAHLITYIRSAVKAQEIRIAVFSESGGKLDASVTAASEMFGIEAHVGSNRHHSVELIYDQPEQTEVVQPLFWMRAFPEVAASFQNAGSGRVKRSVSVDTSFGINAAIAKTVGIDANWLGKQRFEIEVICS